MVRKREGRMRRGEERRGKEGRKNSFLNFKFYLSLFTPFFVFSILLF
jgi:hypothetical protein